MSRLFSVLIVVLFLLIFGCAYYAYLGNKHVILAAEKENRITRIISLANEISSYAKRAEGHLFLYLMTNDQIDQEKFYLRMGALQTNINNLKSLLPDGEDMYLSELSHFYDISYEQGDRLIQLLHANDKKDSFFIDEKNRKLIADFHANTSSIRKVGVNMVRMYLATHLSDREYLLKKVNANLILVILFVLVGFIISLSFLYISRRVARLNDMLHEFSYVDSLTGIGNRRLFDENFTKEWLRAIREQTPLGLMMIDIDDFKLYNDSLGHSEGDKCLISVVNALKQVLQRPSDILIRYGGEEFLAILPNTPEIESLAEKCRQAIADLKLQHVNKTYVSITIGCGVFLIDEDKSQDEILKSLDDALYLGKAQGKNQVVLVNTAN